MYEPKIQDVAEAAQKASELIATKYSDRPLVLSHVAECLVNGFDKYGYAPYFVVALGWFLHEIYLRNQE